MIPMLLVSHSMFLSSAEGEVRMPSGNVAKPDITDNKDGTVTVKYAPTEAGLHEMDIKYDGIHIPGTTYLSAQIDILLWGAWKVVWEKVAIQTNSLRLALLLLVVLHRKPLTVLRGLHEQWQCQCLWAWPHPWDRQQASCLHCEH